MPKMPVYASMHDLQVAKLAAYLEKKGYTIIIDVTNQKLRRIPDLLVVSNKGVVEWVEVESQRWGKKRKKLKHVAKALHSTGGKVRLFYVKEEED